MISMTDEVLKEGNVFNFNGARAIGVSSDNLKPGVDGIVPLSKQDKFEFEKEDNAALNLVDLNMGNLVNNNPVEVSDPSVLGNMGTNEEVNETPEINPYVSQDVFTPTDMNMPQMPEPEAVAPTAVNENLFENHNAIENSPLENTSSEPVVETQTEMVQPEQPVEEKNNELVVEHEETPIMQNEVPTVVAPELTPSEPLVTPEPINELPKTEEQNNLNTKEDERLIIELNNKLNELNNKLDDSLNKIMNSIRELGEVIKTEELKTPQEELKDNSMNNIPSMEVNNPAIAEVDLPTLDAVEPEISSMPSMNAEPPVMEPSIPSLENPMGSSPVPPMNNMESPSMDNMPTLENPMNDAVNPIDETKIQGMFIN